MTGWKKSKITTRYLARKGKVSADRPECTYCGAPLKASDDSLDSSGFVICNKCAGRGTVHLPMEIEMGGGAAEAPPAPKLVAGTRW